MYRKRSLFTQINFWLMLALLAFLQPRANLFAADERAPKHEDRKGGGRAGSWMRKPPLGSERGFSRKRQN